MARITPLTVTCKKCGASWQKLRQPAKGWTGFCKSCSASERPATVAYIKTTCKGCGAPCSIRANVISRWSGCCKPCHDRERGRKPIACLDCGKVLQRVPGKHKEWSGLCRRCSNIQAPHKPKTPAIERFWPKVQVQIGGCWQWLASKRASGYGAFLDDSGKMGQAHRFAYELLVGPIPDDLELDHLCRNRACVNPDHLEPVTARENCLRGISPAAQHAKKTHCKWGHPFTPENTYTPPYKPHSRCCRICRKAADLRQREREKQRKLG